MDSTEYKALYAEGVDARRRGLSYHQNPYKMHSTEYDAWARGWTGMDNYIVQRIEKEKQLEEESHVQEKSSDNRS